MFQGSRIKSKLQENPVLPIQGRTREREREREKQSEWSGEEGGKTRPEEFSKAKDRKIIRGQRKGEGETVERARQGERERERDSKTRPVTYEVAKLSAPVGCFNYVASGSHYCTRPFL